MDAKTGAQPMTGEISKAQIGFQCSLNSSQQPVPSQDKEKQNKLYKLEKLNHYRSVEPKFWNNGKTCNFKPAL